MLLLSSLHIHQSQPSALASCTECVHHQCGGHLAQQSLTLHACVLCQFLTLPMLSVAVAALLIYNNVSRLTPDAWQRNLGTARLSMVALRGPPAV